jgi:hypothetical protein
MSLPYGGFTTMLNLMQMLTFALWEHVRFGSKADICSAKGHVRFAPNSDRESGFPQTVMSALPPKADVCGANSHVCFGPITTGSAPTAEAKKAPAGASLAQ